MERWKDVVGYEGLYEVSNRGRVKSVARQVLRGWGYMSVSERILKSSTLSDNHQMVRLYKSGGGRGSGKDYGVHRLVLLAFVGPCPEGMECCHRDDNPQNNRLGNLRWDTKKGNKRDQFKNGNGNIGNRNGKAKLTEDEVREIKLLLQKGSKLKHLKVIAAKFKRPVATINSIKYGIAWSWLKV